MRLLFSRVLLRCVAVALVPAIGVCAAQAEPVAPARTTDPAETPVVPAATIEKRFSDRDIAEVPDFQKHVIPLLGRLGCNGRACHGSFQGRGGFELSLFGYDFAKDHAALLEDHTGRVDVDDVAESLILTKPVDADMHEGGKRFDRDGWQYRVLRNWIASGAAFEKASVQKLEQLRIEPAELHFDRQGQSTQLTAYAHWEDGTVEDVTPLCRFSSNDESVAVIDENGNVNSGEVGDTHVVVYYDNAVVPIPVLRPIVDASPLPSESIAGQPATKPIDVLVETKLDQLGITASGLCTDSEFIRRASLDITGVLPSADRVEAFLADDSPNKRARLVDQLLDSPAYGAWWATRMSDWTGNNAEQLINVLPVRNVSTKLWFTWLRKRLQDNLPYDQIIAGIVTANSRQDGESYEDYCREMTEICDGDYDRFAERDGMPLFWARRNFQKPEDRAIGFAYAFLGVRIECAQCHKHPFDQWSKQDFDDFAKLFGVIRAGNANLVSPQSKQQRDALVETLTDGKKLRGGELRRVLQKAASKGKVVPFGELYVNTRELSPQQKRRRQAAKRKGQKLPPIRIPTGKILGIDEEVPLSDDPRPALMRWLRDPANPYFAKSIVNRVWGNYFGVGIVDPTDDMNLANPPSNAALLDHLAGEFIANGFDLKWLHREIVNSDTYQRSALTNATNVADRKNFSRHLPRRLPAEVVYDMVVLATGSRDKAEKLRRELDAMAIADGKARQRNRADFALEVFGQSIRETNCDCDRSDSPSLLQSIYLRNDAEMYDRIAARDGWVTEVCKDLGLTPPGRNADPKPSGKQRAVENLRKKIVARIKQVNKLPEPRRQRTLEAAEKQFDGLVKRIGKDFEVPSFEQLVDQPDNWSELVPRETESDGADEAPSLQRVVQRAYLRTLSRYPDQEETRIALDYISESETPARGLEGLMWALVNTKEFIISH